REPADWGPADAAIQQLRSGGYDCVVFTSANGVVAFVDRLRVLGLDARAFGPAQLAAIGPATSAALAEHHLRPDLVPDGDARSEGLAEVLLEKCRGKRVLLAQAVQGRELLRERLQTVAEVHAVAVYEQVAAIDPSHAVFDRLCRGEVDAVTLTSPNVAKAFLDSCDDAARARLREGSTRLVANSERLGAWLRAEGYPVVVAPDPTADGLVTALLELSQNAKGKMQNG
ncbi:MAG TPA: uroporphyrinogen-III synthase, partial [Gemmataceae bacterium]|nr:uroporphyrinogen-III synthase [Gemmataceae bacterium]